MLTETLPLRWGQYVTPMPEGPPHRRPSAGKTWRQYQVNNPAGQPLAEWVYFTPRFPDGIGFTALREAEPAIQIETMLVWFGINLEPYKAQPASEPIGEFVIGVHPIGGGLQPPPVESASVLAEEFGMLTAPAAAAASELRGEWMWRAPLRELKARPGQTFADASGAILGRLEALERAVRELQPAHGGIGHNRPPEELGLSTEDIRGLEADLSIVRAEIGNPTPAAGAILAVVAGQFGRLAKNLGPYVARQLDTHVTEAVKSVGKRTGDLIGLVLIWFLLTRLSHELPQLAEFIRTASGK